MKAKSIFVRGIFLFLGFYFLLPMSFNSVALSQENIKKLSKLQKEYDSLRLRYTQRHPDVAKLKRMIEKLKRTIEKNQKEHEKAAPKQETAPVKEIVQVEEIVPVKKKNNIKKKQHLRKKKGTA